MKNDLLLPSGWESWEVLEEIGSGSSGTVYKARREFGGETEFCAVKVIHIPHESDTKADILNSFSDELSMRQYYKSITDSYLKEIQVLIRLRGNSHIVSIEDYAVKEEGNGCWTIFIRMEYLESFSLYCQNHVLTESDIIKLGTDICEALMLCEKNSIIHRDIKPDNIFRTEYDTYKLGDFGAAKYMDQTATNTIKGTFGYIAPEILLGGTVDSRSDIYTLGLVLYKLLNHNRDPFTDTDKQFILPSEREAAFGKRMSGKPLPAPAEGSPSLKDAVLKACAFSPDDRFRSAAEFRDALNHTAQSDNTEPSFSSEKVVSNAFFSSEEAAADGVTVDADHVRTKKHFRYILLGCIICGLSVCAFFYSKRYINSSSDTISFVSDSSIGATEPDAPCRVLMYRDSSGNSSWPEILPGEGCTEGLLQAVSAVNRTLKKESRSNKQISARITRADDLVFSFYTFEVIGASEIFLNGYTFNSFSGEELELSDIINDTSALINCLTNEQFAVSDMGGADAIASRISTPHCWWLGNDGIHVSCSDSEGSLPTGYYLNVLDGKYFAASGSQMSLFTKSTDGVSSSFYYYSPDGGIYHLESDMSITLHDVKNNYSYSADLPGYDIIKAYYVTQGENNSVLVQLKNSEGTGKIICISFSDELGEDPMKQTDSVTGFIEDGSVSPDTFYISSAYMQTDSSLLYSISFSGRLVRSFKAGTTKVSVAAYADIMEIWMDSYRDYQDGAQNPIRSEDSDIIPVDTSFYKVKGLRFALKDLNGDASPELLILASYKNDSAIMDENDPVIMNVFCLREGNVEPLCTDIHWASKTAITCIYKNGYIIEYNSYCGEDVEDYFDRVYLYRDSVVQIDTVCCYNGTLYEGKDLKYEELSEHPENYESMITSFYINNQKSSLYERLALVPSFEIDEYYIERVKNNDVSSFL